MDTREIRTSLIRKASMNKTLAARVTRAAKGASVLTASQRRDLVDVISIIQDKTAAVEVTPLTKMPGFSPMQLRAEIKKIAGLRIEMEILRKQYETVLKQLSDLDEEEKKGLATLKEAAVELGRKGKFLVEAKEALLEFTAYTQEKRPGIEQMIATPDDPDVLKKGLKAGDLFGRIAAKLGDEVSRTVQELYSQCSEDLTHTAMAIKGLKVVVKTSSLNTNLVKRAGIMDAVVSIKEWLAGELDPIAQRILGFAGSISKWLRGFTERTKATSKATSELKKALDTARDQTDKMLASA